MLFCHDQTDTGCTCDESRSRSDSESGSGDEGNLLNKVFIVVIVIVVVIVMEEGREDCFKSFFVYLSPSLISHLISRGQYSTSPSGRGRVMMNR